MVLNYYSFEALVYCIHKLLHDYRFLTWSKSILTWLHCTTEMCGHLFIAFHQHCKCTTCSHPQLLKKWSMLMWGFTQMNRKVRPASPFQAPANHKYPNMIIMYAHTGQVRKVIVGLSNTKILTILLAEIASLPCNVSQIYCEFQQL